MNKGKYGYHKEMHCEHCKHCIKKAKEEDFKTRISYVEDWRATMYLQGMTIQEAEAYIESQYPDDKWYMYSRDIPTSRDFFKKWFKAKGTK